MEEKLILSEYSITKLQSINHTLIHQLQHYSCFQWHMDYFLPVLPLLHTPLTLLARNTFSENQSLPTQSLYVYVLKCPWSSSWTAWPLKMRTTVVPKQHYLTTNLHCITSQQNKDHIWTTFTFSDKRGPKYRFDSHVPKHLNFTIFSKYVFSNNML
jgi:hypothetical protein